jgi:hypothetical protein
MAEVLLDRVIKTDYGQFDVVYDEEGGFDGNWDRSFAGQVNGLLGAADPHGFYLGFGRRSGGSHLQIMLCDGPPELGAHQGVEWEDVVEASTVVPEDADVSWMSWGNIDAGSLPTLSAGSYRMRLSARGRDVGHADEGAEGVVDHYLLELWPAPVAPDAIVRTTSEDAAYWHREIGSRR